jgi:hypothetical protein
VDVGDGRLHNMQGWIKYVKMANAVRYVVRDVFGGC